MTRESTMPRDAKSLYQELILEHGQRPRNLGPLAGFTHEAKMDNSLCGDIVNIQLRIAEDCVVDARFQARGCLIARASASLLTELVAGRLRAEAIVMADLLGLLVGAGPCPEEVGALEPLRGVREFPARKVCVTLPWEALRRALAPQGCVDPPEPRRTL
jgi:nitrogen fixation protein NifU and related proteins